MQIFKLRIRWKNIFNVDFLNNTEGKKLKVPVKSQIKKREVKVETTFEEGLL